MNILYHDIRTLHGRNRHPSSPTLPTEFLFQVLLIIRDLLILIFIIY